MCGIAGICNFNGQTVSIDNIHKMSKSLYHRGPDDEGLYISPHRDAALAHRRLSIIDLSPQGKQPITNEDQSLQIVFNGEIYNYLELKKDLENSGHIFTSDTDTEVIIHLFEEEGTNCVNKLRGMFAFAIWDEKSKRIFLAKDRLGKKPLYYAVVNNCLWFASEINSLTTIAELPKEINNVAIDSFFSLLYIPSPLTIFKDIKKLEPAHYMYMDKNATSIERYWSLNYEPKATFSFEEAKFLLKKNFTKSVKIRLRSDVPVGCMLSGGVDSSIVAITMAQLSSEPIRTFSIAFDNNQFNEAPHAKLVSDICSSIHTEHLVQPNAIEILPKIVRHYGEPFGDSSALPTWYLSEIARKEVKVSLSGDGGDELFAGYPWYGSALKYQNMSRFAPSSLLKFLASSYETGRLRTGSIRNVSKLASLLAAKEDERFALLRLTNEMPIRQFIYTKDFFSDIQCSAIDYLVNFYRNANATSDLDRYLYVDTLSYLPEELLVKIDRSSMAHSLECRSPLLDHEFVEFAAKLPTKFKLNGSTKKFILKETFKEFFPENFLHRKKQGFSVPLSFWFRKDLKTYVYDTIRGTTLAELGCLDIDFVTTLVDEHMDGTRDHQELIWNCLILAEWVSQNLKK